MQILRNGSPRGADSRIFQFLQPVQHERGLFNPHGNIDAANERLAKAIGSKLAQEYPGRPWGVMAEIEHGIVKIALQGFTQWPVVVKVETLKGDPGLKSVVKYAGELLERLQLSREKFSLSDWKTANTRLPWHFNRNAKAPE